MTDHRTDPPVSADEVDTLRGFLDFHRETLRWKTSGLDAAELAHRVRPSSMTLGGLLKHLAFVESQWFSQVLLDEPLMAPFDTADWADDRDWDWTSAAGDSPAALRMLFDRAVAASDAILDDALADGGLDRLSARPDRHTGEHWNLRWILVHMIEEYARHNGHADLLREAIDGTVGE
ncbi:DinB family protein [Cellulosimicrobium cellulans]|uniref:Mini-circle protein n=1 Tax=Cellulosimicrobium cellulans TaxID=1710 RepID=A0A4Y4DY57_CELCE|nr:DinB family protein [Cellulosimicrobium cellulans]MDF9877360.1 putative damage-inducible protein DinB [Cellulosimicrobium cellulans]GED10369.1 mini-circle protein [Cellulosimicrobium cellulans]